MRTSSLKEGKMTRQLTKGEILQARALFYLAKTYERRLNDCEKELAKLVEPEVEPWMGHTGDTIFQDNGTIEILFEKLGIEFED